MSRPVSLAAAVGLIVASCGGSLAEATDVVELGLSAGADETTETFEVRTDPTTHSQSITVEIAPPTKGVDLYLRTSTGFRLNVLPHGDSCMEDQSSMTCSFLWPILEAQAPGLWEAHAAKGDGPATKVRLSIEWVAVDP